MVDRIPSTPGGNGIAKARNDKPDIGAGAAKSTQAAVPATTTDAVDLSGVANSNVIRDMASSAPIDNATIDRLRDMIRHDGYPFNLDHLTEQLMEAYREMTS